MTPFPTYQQLVETADVQLPSKTIIDAWFDGTAHMSKFADTVMVKLLGQLLRPTDKETAICDTYYRLVLYLRSLLALNRLDHVQSVASAARSIMELWLDIELLEKDIVADGVVRFFSFAELERYRQAKQIIEFADKNPGAINMDLTAQRTFSTNQDRFDRLAKIWGTDKHGNLKRVSHWSGMDLRARGHAIGQEAEAAYIQTQAMMSWYVHAGSAGTYGMNRIGLESVYSLSHIDTQRFFLKATQACARATRISKLPEFSGWMTNMLFESGKIITEEQLKELERQRGAPGAKNSTS